MTKPLTRPRHGGAAARTFELVAGHALLVRSLLAATRAHARAAGAHPESAHAPTALATPHPHPAAGSRPLSHRTCSVSSRHLLLPHFPAFADSSSAMAATPPATPPSAPGAGRNPGKAEIPVHHAPRKISTQHPVYGPSDKRNDANPPARDQNGQRARNRATDQDPHAQFGQAPGLAHRRLNGQRNAHARHFPSASVFDDKQLPREVEDRRDTPTPYWNRCSGHIHLLAAETVPIRTR